MHITLECMTASVSFHPNGFECIYLYLFYRHLCVQDTMHFKLFECLLNVHHNHYCKIRLSTKNNILSTKHKSSSQGTLLYYSKMPDHGLDSGSPDYKW
ncbi:hypothetical protein QTP88_024287 [Uroleucon formosanum]